MTEHRTIIGIDEAGYGPLLGPLVVGATAFRVHGEGSLAECLPIASKRSGPAPVDDSKVILRGAAGRPRLERSVLAWRSAAAAFEVPDRPRGPDPWGLAWPASLPAFADGDSVAAAGRAVGEALAGGKVEVLSIRTRTVDVAEFNAECARLGSKASLLFLVAMGLLEPWLEEEGEVEVLIDRHGGRAYYAALLAERFPDRFPLVVREDRRVSTYRFRRDAGDVEVSFIVDGDRHHLATALASMAAKYVRELWMRDFNDWFGEEDPALRATAGYHQDALRWLRDSATVRRRLGVSDEALVRVR